MDGALSGRLGQRAVGRWFRGNGDGSFEELALGEQRAVKSREVVYDVVA